MVGAGAGEVTAVAVFVEPSSPSDASDTALADFPASAPAEFLAVAPFEAAAFGMLPGVVPATSAVLACAAMLAADGGTTTVRTTWTTQTPFSSFALAVQFAALALAAAATGALALNAACAGASADDETAP
jgi:hypothetical protein